MQRTVAQPNLSSLPPPEGKERRRMVTIFYGNLLGDSSFKWKLRGGLETFIWISYCRHSLFKQNDSLRVALLLRSLSLCDRGKKKRGGGGLHPIITEDTFAHNVSCD